MSPIYKSGAFMQQCFAVHPLALALKKFTGGRMSLSCASCQLLHRFSLRECSVPAPAAFPSEEAPRGGPDGAEHLARCVAAHPEAIGVRGMDVIREFVGLRCAECRRAYELTVTEPETYQK